MSELSNAILRGTLSEVRHIKLPHLKKLRYEENMQKVQHYDNREWMKKRGKSRYIDFDNHQRSKLRKVFKELDKDCSGALDIDELYEPLLALGLVESREQVIDLLKKIDLDTAGIIEFEEFLNMLKNAKDNDGGNTLIKFFKDLTSGKIFNNFEELPFHLFLSGRRREFMMQSYTGKNMIIKEKGNKILSAYAAKISENQSKEKDVRLKSKKQGELVKLLERQNCLRNAQIPTPERLREYSKGKRLTRMEALAIH